MKAIHLFVLVAWLLPVLPAAAQTSPTLDPSFPVVGIYQPTIAEVALQLSSGARVVAGRFDRAGGQLYSPAYGSSLVRYLPGGAPDAVFNATVAAGRFSVQTLAEASNGKLLLGLAGAATLGGQPVAALVQLNADGTRDAAFANPAPGIDGFVSRLLVQPDGKILVGGNLAFLPQTPVPGLARLNADGTPDATFQAQLSTGRIADVSGLARQADGKLLVAAYVVLPGSSTGEYQLVRLLANGAQDPTFQPVLTAGVILSDVAVQPDGQVLVSAAGGQPVRPGSPAGLARLSATGAPDATFAPDPALFVPRLAGLPLLAVQPDGRILLGHWPANLPAGQAPVARLLASGAFDPAWSTPQVPADALLPRLNSLQVLPNGQLLVAGTLQRLGDANGLERGAALLGSTGQPDGSFLPVLQQNGVVRDVAQQPDGRLVAVGTFNEVGDAPARGIVRFQLDGSVDTAFSRRARLGGGFATRVLVQPDASVVVGGDFVAVGGVAQAAVVRLLPGGTPDAAFPSPLASGASVTEMARQPDGQLLLAGNLRRPSPATPAGFLRVNGTGGLDATFLPPAGVTPLALLVQPDGAIVVGSTATGRQVLRLLPSGAQDPAFASPTLGAPSIGAAAVRALSRQPDGRLLVAGSFVQAGAVNTAQVARLLPNGTPDATFATQLLQPSGRATAVVVQPNGRVLVGGTTALPNSAAAPSLFRLLPDGSTDPDFDSNRGPDLGRNQLGTVRVLVQANGAIVAAGGFATVSGLPVVALTRLLDANVLASHRTEAGHEVQAWPVPAHGLLHVAVGAGPPARICLLNVLGQVVFTQKIPVNNVSIATNSLPPGTYLVRVEYAGVAPILRRVVLE
ncbi:T9SS type A sorting domain-containing protein [Hymenobacter rubidus]|uniref:T9SS type A sorting domain-containing protein n=1 Tax=Hymenobacter rubidus TaxID=1441626 RepID=UPI00191E18B1|nr:T9SS type A sorting domain-containing protein [Hymenobacter rubidus]